MDKRELEGLLNDVTADPPAASFTVHDVTAESRRITRRRRFAAAGVAGACVLLAGGGVVVGSVLDGAGGVATSSVAGNEAGSATDPRTASGKSGGAGQPDVTAKRGSSAQSFPEVSSKQGDEAGGEDGPRAGSTAGCDTADRELAVALAGELPVGPEAEPVASPVVEAGCGPGVRAAAFPVRGATISVILAPPGTRPDLRHQPGGTTSAERRVPGGATVLVVRTPATATQGTSGAPGDSGTGGDLDAIAVAVARVVGD